MKKALLIANGIITNYEIIKNKIKTDKYHITLCVDGGIDHALSLDIIPDIVIGDFDSTSIESMEFIEKHHIKTIKFPVEKDETDTEIALDYLAKSGCNHISMIACTGNRLDHTLANIYLLKNLLDKKITGTILDENNCIYLIKDNTEFIDRKGDIVSLLPFSDNVSGVTTRGLYYPLINAPLYKEKSLGISNLIVDNHAWVRITEGELLIIISRD